MLFGKPFSGVREANSRHMHSVKASTWLTNNPKKSVNSMCWNSGLQVPRPGGGSCRTLVSGKLGEDSFAVRRQEPTWAIFTADTEPS